MSETPPPFAGWLEEHPEGGFVLVRRDGLMSPVLTSYEAVSLYLDDHDLGPDDLETVIRARHASDDLAAFLAFEPKLYPPETFRA